MNKIFKTKYDITTGQCKAVSELANNRQIASSSESKPKCGVFFGGMLGAFKVMPLVVMSGLFSSGNAKTEYKWIQMHADSFSDKNGDNSTGVNYQGAKNTLESVILANEHNKTGSKTTLKNQDFSQTVVIGSRAVGGGKSATSIGYRAIVGINEASTKADTEHQGTAVGYRTFARGTGATSVGNDTVAWGDSSIAIGSDTASSQGAKPLPKAIFELFLNNATNFNYTKEYSAVDFRRLLDVSNPEEVVGEFVDKDGNLINKSKQLISWNGKYYIRDPKNRKNDYTNAYIMIDGDFYEQNGHILNKIEDSQKINEIKNLDDYKLKLAHDKRVNDAYEKYLDKGGSHKQSNSTYNNTKTHTWAKGNNSIAIGARSIAYGDYTTALGTFAIAYKNHSTAIGSNTIAFGTNSLVVGNGSYVYADKTVGIGTNVQAINAGSMVYGSDSYAGGTGSLAIGNYALANIEMDSKFNNKGLEIGTNGFQLTDEHNKDKYIGKFDYEKFYELGNTADIQAHKNLIKPNSEYQEGTGEYKAKQSRDKNNKYNQGAIAIGSYSVALGDNTLTIGRYAYAKEDSAIAIGRFSFAKEKDSFAIGSFTRAIGQASIALGNNTYSGQRYSVSIGYKSQSQAESGVALGIQASVDKNATGAMAIGNNAEANLANSVALGYESTTNYFYTGNDKSTATFSGQKAIDLDGYVPEGSSYKIANDNAVGIISVGGWDNSKKSHLTETNGATKSAVGLRRIVNVAPGALDSDVATVGQLKALEYTRKEGVVVYYTVENGKNIKLVKDQGIFYKVNTKDGTPLKDLGAISADQVLVGAKGDDEQIQTISEHGKNYKLKDIGNSIRFGHLKDGEIKSNSDHAITGNQLHQLSSILGLNVNADKTKFKSRDFIAVEYIGSTHGSQNTFKGAIDELITAVNKGYKFDDGTNNSSTKDTPFYLGSTIEIKAGDISSNNKKTYSGTNLKTKFKPKDGDNTVAEFTIGLSDTPSFTSVTVTGIVDDNSDGKTLTTKTYVDGKLANVAANFTVKGDDGGVGYTLNKDNTELNIKGKQAPNTHQNIKTSVNSGSKAVNIELNSELKGVKSITGKDIPNGANSTVNSKIEFNRQNGSKATTNVTISSNGANYTFDRTGLDVNDRRITRLQSGFNRSHKGQQNSVETATLSTILDGTYDKDNQKTKIENNAVNVGDLSKVAQEILKKELTFQGNGGETDKVTRKLGETLKIVGKGDQANNVTVANNNIKVSKNTSSDGLEIGLSDALTGIKSIANGDNAKIALENDKKAITFTAGDQTNTKDVTLSAGKFSGVSQVGVDDNNALVFKNGDSKKTAELKVGGASLTFTPTGTNQTVKISNLADGQITDTSTDAITGKQLNDLAGKLGVTVNNTTGFTQPSFTAINYKDSKKTQQSTFKGAIEDLITAVNKGIVFKGNEDKAQPITMQLGGSLTIDSSSAGNEKDITAKVATDGVDGSAKITLGLNKANTVAEDDEKVVTSKAVATILKQYTKTSDIGNTYLKIDGTNIGGDSGKKTFGQNVGLAAINLTTDKESTQLVQAKALIAYLKGAGEKSVKISDNLETKAEGEGSISIGDKAVSKNEGSIALGYGANALNTASISIGQNSIVTGLKAVSLGSNNTVGGDSSIVLGETNTVAGVQSFVMGTNNNISGRENIVFGSRNTVSANSNIVFGSDITIDDTNITDAIVLGNGSTAEKTALSIGNEKIKRRIANVAEPTKEYDAANKKYVDARGLKFKGNDGQEQRVNLDKLLTIDSSESKTKDGNTQEKDIKTSVTKEGDEAKLTLTLNKADKVSEHDERAVTSKAVHAAIGEVKNSLANAEISYKANGKGDKTVKLTDGFDFTDGSNTTAEVGEKGVVKFNLNKELKDMTSFETEAKDGNKAKLDQSGLTVGDSTNGSDKTHATYGKDGLSINGQDGQSAVSLKVKNASGKDTATLAFAKEADKKTGTGVITGLKDLDANADGSSAANKNYVDEKFGEVDKKIAAANTNRPFDYYAGDDKVVKGEDGKFYKEAELKDAKFADGKYTDKDGQELKTTVKQDDVVIKAEPNSKPMKLTNLKDGDLSDDSKDAITGSQLVKATGAKLIDDPSSTSDPKAKKMVFADGKDGKSGLEADSMAMKGLTGKDGLNGQNANDKANALRNGEAGTVVFTDNKGERLVKANDGKYYKVGDVEDNGTPKADKSAVDNPQLSLVNTGGETDKPVVLGNVANGLGIDADKAKEAADKTNNANKVVRDKAKDLSDKVSDMLKKGEELDTLRFSKEAQQDAVDALETALKYMPEETDAEKEAKSRVKDNLKREKQKLSELTDKFTGAEKRVKEAKEAVEKAKDTLKTSKSSYENALKESNREINALLSGDKKINVHRGANLQDLQALGQAGLNFEGNDGVPVHKNLGEKLTIKGEGEFNSVTTAAGNIKVDASETGLDVKLSDTLKNMTSFETKETVEGNKSRLDGNGLRVTHKDGKSAQYGVDGVRLTDGKHSATLTPSGLTLTNPQGQRIEIDGAKGEIRVPDLTPNSSPNAVVNKGYVDALQTHTDKKFNQLENRFDAFSKESRAGIAGSNAAAALPTISIPGKSVLSVSAGTYKGQSAVALGYSRVSDNGKVLLKLHGNSNSVGDFGGGVGIGWAW